MVVLGLSHIVWLPILTVILLQTRYNVVIVQARLCVNVSYMLIFHRVHCVQYVWPQ